MTQTNYVLTTYIKYNGSACYKPYLDLSSLQLNQLLHRTQYLRELRESVSELRESVGELRESVGELRVRVRV
jgi:hypothetical protein